jgi:hypothetical protein
LKAQTNPLWSEVLPTLAPGLYRGAPETLKAESKPVKKIAINDLSSTVSYINKIHGTYTMLIDQDIDAYEQIMDSRRVNLTIIGLGEQRKIKAVSPTGRLFTIGNCRTKSISLTIGNNIFLAGMVLVQKAKFIILDGSKIGDLSSGVYTDGSYPGASDEDLAVNYSPVEQVM